MLFMLTALHVYNHVDVNSRYVISSKQVPGKSIVILRREAGICVIGITLIPHWATYLTSIVGW